MLGSMLRQMVNGMKRIPDEISRTFQEQKKAIGGRNPQLQDVSVCSHPIHPSSGSDGTDYG